MLAKKENFLDKIVKKDYQNELEKILEEKDFSENAKSILLSIMYKIEAAYKDLQTVKRDVEDKEQYEKDLIEIIKNKCNSINIVKMTDEENKILKNRTYIIDKEKGNIIAYPIERKLLYAIYKIDKKEKIIKNDYFLINETLSNLINVGNNINMVEPLRDFNGYSWTTIPKEIESIEHNLIYQNLRILVGEKFLKKWIANSEFIIDYYDLFQEKLQNDYSKDIKEKIVNTLDEISILLEIKFNSIKEVEYTKIKEELEEQIQQVKNKEEFIQQKTKEKIDLTEQIRKLDTIINNKSMLEEEYQKRNEVLPLEKKIFSIRILIQILEKERETYLLKIEELNNVLKPKNFVNYTKELEEKYKYLSILNEEDKSQTIEKLKIEFQKVFLQAIRLKIKKADTKAELEKIIDDFRYYEMLPYNESVLIKEITELQKLLEKTEKLILDKAIELKIFEKVSEDENTNYIILKNIFKTRIIKLEEAYLKITKEKDQYFVQIFDENIFEEKVKIQKPKDLNIKLNKKIAMSK